MGNFATLSPYCDHSGKWRWRLRASNGRIIADSAEAYATRSNLRRAMKKLLSIRLVIKEEISEKINLGDMLTG